MVEIFIIAWLSKKISLFAQNKSYGRRLFRGLAIGAWFVAEILGLVGAIALMVAWEDFRQFIVGDFHFVIYIFMVAGAGLGVLLVVLIIHTLPVRKQKDDAGLPQQS
jgi:hypothetical protein